MATRKEERARKGGMVDDDVVVVCQLVWVGEGR